MTNDPDAIQRGQDASSTNPYAPTTNIGSALPQMDEDVDAYRRHYLKHEVSVKSIGVLYYLGSVILIVSGVGMFMVAGSVNAGQNSPPTGPFAAVGLLYFSLGVFQFFVARGLRRLQPWTRIATSVLSLIGLLGFPVGTLISAYILYLMLNEKGQVVFSDSYKQVILLTPHIRYKTSIVIWIFLAILALIIIALIAAALVVG